MASRRRDLGGHRDYPQLRDSLARLLRDDPFSRYGVHAVGIGRKLVAGQPTPRLALRFYVACKLPPSRLPPERRIPRSFPAPSARGEQQAAVITDVIESAPPEPHVDPESKLRPVPGGASCSSVTYYGTGTIGGWVWDNTDDTIVMLSNQHVFGNTVGGPIIQPGTSDGGQLGADRIGEVKRSVPLVAIAGRRPVPEDCNFVDAAVGEPDTSELFDLTVLEIGPAVYDIDDPAVGAEVEKSGQESGHTVGEITDVDYNVQLSYPEGEVAICDCFRIEPSGPAELWGTNGDSGSLVFARDDASVIKPVLGLYFGGGGVPPHNYGIACKITNVFAALDLGRLCDGGFAAFLDALFAAESPDATGAALFTLRERSRRRSQLGPSGLARAVQARLATSRRGRLVSGLVDDHRAELFALLVGDGDTRRAAVAALEPILRGAVTTADVLERKLTANDVERLERLLAVVAERAGEPLRRDLERSVALVQRTSDRSVAEILGVRL